MDKRTLLTSSSFGARVAEDEGDRLSTYFVETDEWRRVFDGKDDVVRGPKGSGKSAIYSLLLDRTSQLFDRNILVTAAENPRGTTVFQNLVTDPPAGESEFIYLWKVYLLTLVADMLIEHDIDNEDADAVVDALVAEGLIDRGSKRQRSGLFRSALDYVRGLLAFGSIEGGLAVDPVSGVHAVTAKITLEEPSLTEHEHGYMSADELLQIAGNALKAEGFEVWVLLDRLDVAFADNRELEASALRALFRVYNDIAGVDGVKLKIFLRRDIWNRVFEEGFAEASHITRIVDISWDESSLLNLIVKRALSNEAVVSYYECDADEILGDIEKQEKLFYRMFPDQIEVGQRKSTTIRWIVTRTQDGTREPAPRELLHLLEESREAQIKAYDVGRQEPQGERMITAAIVKDALSIVSKARLEQTLYAEYPQWKHRVSALEEKKTEQTVGTLAAMWGVSEEDAARDAQVLVEIGFFAERRDKGTYWVPFLYRAALSLVQGMAEL